MTIQLMWLLGCFAGWSAMYGQRLLVSLQMWSYEYNGVYAFEEGNIITDDWEGPGSQTWMIVKRTARSYYLADEGGIIWEFTKWDVEHYFCRTTSNSEKKRA